MPDFGRWTANGGDPSLNEINRTDRFIDALASAQPVYSTDPGEAELAQLLAGWRDEVRDAPMTAPVTPRDAVIALHQATASRRRNRFTLAVVGSVAAAVLCIGGFGAVVAGSGPGDPLYGLRTMLFGEQQTTRDDAVMLASQQLAEVQQLIDQGQWDAAQEKLQTITTTVATVGDDSRKQDLVAEWQQLTVKVEAQDAAATLPPGAPPPEMPVVVVPETTTVTTSETTATTTPSSETTTPSSETTSPTTTPATPSTTSTTPSSASETTTPSSSPSAQTTTPTSTTAPTSTVVQQTAASPAVTTSATAPVSTAPPTSTPPAPSAAGTTSAAPSTTQPSPSAQPQTTTAPAPTSSVVVTTTTTVVVPG